MSVKKLHGIIEKETSRSTSQRKQFGAPEKQGKRINLQNYIEHQPAVDITNL
jgi:hypothetical protein